MGVGIQVLELLPNTECEECIENGNETTVLIFVTVIGLWCDLVLLGLWFGLVLLGLCSVLVLL